MLDPTLAAQLQAHLEKVQMPVELLMSLDDSPKSEEMEQLLHEVAAMSDRITVERRDDDPRRPSFAIHRAGTDIAVRFAGVPLGHEFTSFVLALLQVGGYPAKVEPSTLEAIRALDGESHFETYFSLSCQNCPDVVQALNLMSVLNPRITHTAIDGGVFPEEIEERGIMAVPTVYRNGAPFASGRMSLEEILGKIDETAPARAAERLASQAPFEVLVVGAGPAGATAAIYAARKGLRTGLIAERFGGQLLDTLAIENFSSVSYTEGPKLANELEYHVREYDVEVLLPHRVASLHPAEDGWAVEVADGPTLRTRTLILATGARWRTMGVPGEEEYRTKGVTFCPHCDGPLFAGKRVAVIGGGNSGVEAAIDLAAVVAHVTLLEFDGALRADEVLQRKLASLPNVDVCLNAATQEVLGDGSKVTGLQFMDRDRGVIEKLALDGVFVQIGLLPNTEWLDGTLPLNDRGEIEVDAGGRTSLPGVFAAGDSTSTPFKQIVVAAGAGATAALSASEYLIRS